MDLICRTCSQTKTECVNLFNYYHNNKLILEMLNECTPVEFQKDDGLPLHICSECLESLISAWHFRRMTITTDVELRKCFSEQKLATKSQQNDNDTIVVKEETIVKDDAFNSLIIKSENVYITDVTSNEVNERSVPSISKANHGSSCNQDTHLDIQTCNAKQLQHVPENSTMKHEYAENYQNISNSTINDQNLSKDLLECRTENLNNLSNIPVSKISIDQKNVSINKQSSLNHENYQVKSTNSQDQVPSLTNNIEHSNDISKPMTISHDINDKRKTLNSVFHIQPHKESIQDVSSKDDNGSSDKSKNKPNKLVILEQNRKPTHEEKVKTPVHCKICNKSFHNRYYYHNVHVRQHEGDLPHNCKTCGKSFARPSLLKLHAIMHSDTRPFVCDTCGKGFKSANNLQIHKTAHIDDRPYKCNICHLDFKSDNILKGHIRRHENKRNHVCETCGKSYVTRSELRSHLNSHLNIKDHICTECGKAFSTSTKLRNHFRCNHTNERPYACAHCDKRFKDKGVLKKHSLIHTGEKPYLCKLCGKSFRHSVVLNTHMRSHTGETPYACKLCPSQFKYRQLLTNHMKTHK